MNHGPHVKAEKLCRRLKRDGYPKGIQVLCANCNFAKSYQGFLSRHEINFSILKTRCSIQKQENKLVQKTANFTIL